MSTRFITGILLTGILAGCGSDSEEPIIIDPTIIDPVIVDTIDYEVSDFVSIDVNGSFEVTLRQGSSFKVEVRIDSTEASKLDVGVQGDRLNIGFIPNVDVRADTLEAVIEMPNIEALTLNGSNNVLLTGFNGATLEVSIDGDNVLDGRDSTFDYVMATVSGSSLLDFTDVTALPSAHIELSGSSSATLNLMDFASITGSLTGTSALLYYGSSINLELTVGNAANVTRLGGTI